MSKFKLYMPMPMRKQSESALITLLETFLQNPAEIDKTIYPLFLLFSDQQNVAEKIISMPQNFFLYTEDMALFSQLVLASLNKHDDNYCQELTNVFSKIGFRLCFKRLREKNGLDLYAILNGDKKENEQTFSPEEITSIKANYLLILLAKHPELMVSIFSDLMLCEDVFREFIFKDDAFVELEKETANKYITALVNYHFNNEKICLPTVVVNQLFSLSVTFPALFYSKSSNVLSSTIVFTYFSGLDEARKMRFTDALNTDVFFDLILDKCTSVEERKWLISFFNNELGDLILSKLKPDQLDRLSNAIVETKDIGIIELFCAKEQFSSLPAELVSKIKPIVHNELKYKAIIRGEEGQFSVNETLIAKNEKLLDSLNSSVILSEIDHEKVRNLVMSLQKAALKKKWFIVLEGLGNIIINSFTNSVSFGSYLPQMGRIRRDYRSALTGKMASLADNPMASQHYVLANFPEPMVEDLKPKTREVEGLLRLMDQFSNQYECLNEENLDLQFIRVKEVISQVMHEKLQDKNAKSLSNKKREERAIILTYALITSLSGNLRKINDPQFKKECEGVSASFAQDFSIHMKHEAALRRLLESIDSAEMMGHKNPKCLFTDTIGEFINSINTNNSHSLKCSFV